MAKINIRKFIERLQYRRSLNKKNKQQSVESHRIHAYELEPRVLYSAAPIPVEMAEGLDVNELAENPLFDSIDLQTADDVNSQAFSQNEVDDDLMLGLSESFGVEPAIANEFVFVDAGVADFEWVSQQIQDEFPEANVVVLDSQVNGIEQITDALAGAQHVSAVHFISHGSDGNVQLGNSMLNNETLGLFTDQIVQWSHSLTLEADLYFYGCNLAGSETGVELLESLEAITGADLAASDDLTGHESLGGDWDLEYQSGDLSQSDIAFSQLQENWNSVLGVDLQPDSISVDENGSVTGNVLDNDGTFGHFLSAAPIFLFDANQDDVEDGVFVNETGNGLDLQHNSSVTRTLDPTNSPNSVYAAYEFNGDGAESLGVPNFSDSDGTLELWFNPSDGDGQEILFDIGNANGTTLRLNGNQLEFHSVDANVTAVTASPVPVSSETLTTTIDLSSEIAANEYIHFVGVLDNTGSGTSMSLYINGELVDVDTNANFFNWANATADGTSLGGPSGAATATASSGADGFFGEIAAFNIYNRVLNADEVAVNFESAFLEVVSHDSVSGQGVPISVDAQGNFTYTPGSQFDFLREGESTVDTFNYQAVDSFGNASEQFVEIIINGENDAPVSLVNGVVVGGNEDLQPVHINLLENVTDPEGDFLTVANLVNTTGNAPDTFVSADGNFLTFDPNFYSELDEGESVAVEYTYEVVDGNGGSIDQSILFNVAGINDAPEFLLDAAHEYLEDSGLQTINLLDGFSDDESHALNLDSLELLSGNDVGVTLSGNTLAVDPGAYNSLSVGEFETLTYRYTVTDGFDVSESRQLTIQITGENDTPIVTSAVEIGFTANTGSFNVDLLEHYFDPDISEELSATNVVQTSGSLSAVGIAGDIVTINTDLFGSLAAGETHVITFTYRVSDDFGLFADQTATITIVGDGPGNDAPTVSGVVMAAADETDASFRVDLLAGAVDPEGFALNIENLGVLSGDASGITFNPATGELNVDPSVYSSLNNGESETIVYGYEIVDVGGARVNQTAEIVISGVDLGGPTVNLPLAVLTNEDQASFAFDLLAGALDPDGGELNVESFVLTGGDDRGISLVDDSLQIDPSAYNNLAVDETETVTFSYDIVDDDGNVVKQTVTISIEGRNDDPVVSGDLTVEIDENDPAFGMDLLQGAIDPDSSDTLSVIGISTVSGNAVGVGPISTTGIVSIDPDAYDYLAEGEVEIIVFEFDVVDGNGGQIPRSLVLQITGQNDAPTISAIVTESMSEDEGTVTHDLLAHATDLDINDSLNVENLVLTAGDGTGVVFDPTTNSVSIDTSAYDSLALGENEVITYQYDVVDSQGAAVRQQAVFTIEGRNDAPIVSSEIVEGATEDAAAFVVDLLDNTTDPDSSDVLSVENLVVTSGDAVGITINADDTLKVDPSAYNNLADGEFETIVYQYDIVDSAGATVTQTATITITGVNDAPTVSQTVVANTNEDAASFDVDLLEYASDVDNNEVLSVANLVVTSGDAAGVTVNADDTLTVDPSAYNSLAFGETEVIAYEYEVTDEFGASVRQQTVITVTGSNDGPVASGPEVTLLANEDDAAFAVDLLAGATDVDLSLIHISEPTRPERISYAVFCLKKKK